MAEDWGSKSRAGTSAGVFNVVPSPTAASGSSGKPMQETGWKDFGWAVFFWVHVLVIIGIAATLGRTALAQDMGVPEDDPNRGVLDFNAVLFLKVIALACGISVFMSSVMLWVLQKYAASLITCALYTSLVVQAALTAAMFTINIIFGIVMAILFVLTAMYVYYVRKRIPFAAAHMETAVAVTRAHSGVYWYAFSALWIEAAWSLLWAVAAFGLEHAINNATASTPSTPSGSGTDTPTTSPKTSGGIISFVMLLSLLWGVQLIKYTCHFVVADTVGHWWFERNPRNAVSSAVKRAYTTSFGSLSFGAFIIAFLETLRRAARAAQNKAERDGNSALAILACLATCIIGCVEGIAAYMNTWAIPIMALTGADFVRSGKEAMNLFRQRGWDAVVNDDLVGDALRIASLMTASASALVGACVVYVGMPSSPSRGGIAGVAAIFCFVIGYALCSLMMGVLVSAVKAVFVAFAMDPAALSGTHPEYLQKLVNAWQTAHPAVFAQCGYAQAYAGQQGSYAPPAPAPIYPGGAGGYPSAPPAGGHPGQPLAQQAVYPGAYPQGYPQGGYAQPAPGHAYTGAPMAQGGYTSYQGGPFSGYPPSMV